MTTLLLLHSLVKAKRCPEPFSRVRRTFDHHYLLFALSDAKKFATGLDFCSALFLGHLISSNLKIFPEFMLHCNKILVLVIFATVLSIGYNAVTFLKALTT
jgi:hypothetical protein